jgi:hypothetical protein
VPGWLCRGAYGGHGDGQGGVRWLGSLSALRGRGRVLARWRALVGGRWRWLVRSEEEERGSGIAALGLLPPS